MKEPLHPESAGNEAPAPATELLQVPGLGPKRVQILHGAGVQSVAQLRAAAQERRLRCVPGFSAALEENILRAMAHLECEPGRPDPVMRERPWARRKPAEDRKGATTAKHTTRSERKEASKARKAEGAKAAKEPKDASGPNG